MSATEAARSVRALSASDAAAMVALQSLPGVRFGTLRLPHPSVERVRKFLENPGETNTQLGVFADDALIAIGGLTGGVGRRAHIGLIGMAVHDDWVGQGVGTLLLGELVSLGERWLGLRRLELHVFCDNARAIALYRRFGFEIEGTHRSHAMRDGVFVDGHTMARLRGFSDAEPTRVSGSELRQPR